MIRWWTIVSHLPMLILLIRIKKSIPFQSHWQIDQSHRGVYSTFLHMSTSLDKQQFMSIISSHLIVQKSTHSFSQLKPDIDVHSLGLSIPKRHTALTVAGKEKTLVLTYQVHLGLGHVQCLTVCIHQKEYLFLHAAHSSPAKSDGSNMKHRLSINLPKHFQLQDDLRFWSLYLSFRWRHSLLIHMLHRSQFQEPLKGNLWSAFGFGFG